MHELSLAMATLDLLTDEARQNGITRIHEFVVEVGKLSGVDAEAYKFALELTVKDTIFEKARIRWVLTPGKGKCSDCNLEFDMEQRLDICPSCFSSITEVIEGDHFKVLSMTGD
jgi:hydrogenase nickel incorporation protein HypA/HybF